MSEVEMKKEVNIKAKTLFDGSSAGVLAAIFSLLLCFHAWSQETTRTTHGRVHET